jgi:hypothetical protein
MRSFTCLLWILTLTTSCVLEDQPVGGGDAGICGSCPTPRPVCHEETQTCVQCTAQDSSACVDDTPVCNAETFECVGCTANSNCTTPTAARCDTETNECTGCEGTTDCDGITGLPACNNGTCVQCTSDASCNGKSCNTNTFDCTTTDVGSLETCEECVADSECGETNNRCVVMFYRGDRHPTAEAGYCLKTTEGDCERPYAIPLADRASLSGGAIEEYCGINEELATCEAVRALLNDDPRCADGDNLQCPQPSGKCREVGTLQNRCTYFCSGVTQCDEPPNPGSTCGSSSGSGGSGGSAGGDYCGGG